MRRTIVGIRTAKPSIVLGLTPMNQHLLMLDMAWLICRPLLVYVAGRAYRLITLTVHRQPMRIRPKLLGKPYQRVRLIHARPADNHEHRPILPCQLTSALTYGPVSPLIIPQVRQSSVLPYM
jgi:hypothetical protein